MSSPNLLPGNGEDGKWEEMIEITVAVMGCVFMATETM
jgi:hypothetical protein